MKPKQMELISLLGWKWMMLKGYKNLNLNVFESNEDETLIHLYRSKEMNKDKNEEAPLRTIE